MTNGYSNDFRESVLVYYDKDHTQIETGSAHLRPRPKQRRTRKIDEKRLKAYLQAHPDAYLHEIGAVFEVSASAILYACQRYGITRKKVNALRRA